MSSLENEIRRSIQEAMVSSLSERFWSRHGKFLKDIPPDVYIRRKKSGDGVLNVMILFDALREKRAEGIGKYAQKRASRGLGYNKLWTNLQREVTNILRSAFISPDEEKK